MAMSRLFSNPLATHTQYPRSFQKKSVPQLLRADFRKLQRLRRIIGTKSECTKRVLTANLGNTLTVRSLTSERSGRKKITASIAKSGLTIAASIAKSGLIIALVYRYIGTDREEVLTDASSLFASPLLGTALNSQPPNCQWQFIESPGLCVPKKKFTKKVCLMCSM